MSLTAKARVTRALLATSCAIAVVLVSVTPAAAQNDDRSGKSEKRAKDHGHYVVKRGPCKLDELPKGAVHQWTRSGESIVHKVRYGQGLQEIAWSYGFKGDNAYRKLWDANPQLKATWLERPGITIRIPVCGTEQKRRKLPEPPPPPEPEESETDESAETASSGGSDPAPEPEPEPAAAVPSGSVWDALAECESGGDWSINTGNGYYGGLQFSLSSWQAVGGSGYPHEHSREEQIKRGKILQERAGWGSWPACSAELGLN